MKRIITLIFAIALLLVLHVPTTTVWAVGTEGSSAGDIHDDRPDDTNDRPGDVYDDRPNDASDQPSDGAAVGGDNSTATTSISDEARAWAQANGFDLAAFEEYTPPAAHEPSAADIAAFEAWMSGGSNPRNQVLKQMQEAAGEAVAAELWNYCNTIWKGWMNAANVGSVVSRAGGLKNVGAMQEGMFAGYFGSLLGGNNGYANAGLLIKAGFVVSSDDVTYRLHNMIDGTTAYEAAAPERAVVSEDEFPEGLTSFTDFLPLETQTVTDEVIALLKQHALSGKFSDPTGIDRTVYQAAAQYVNQKFGDYYGQCPGPTVVKGITALGIALDSVTEDTVGSSVGEKEFVASFFGAESAAAGLWRLGFLPSFDGTTYRLHSGKDGSVVYEALSSDLQAQSGIQTETAKKNTAGIVLIAAIVAFGIVAVAIIVFNRRKKSRGR